MYEESKIAQTANAPQRLPQVAESFDALERTVEAHLKLCAELEQRLAPVLRNEPEATESGSKPEQTVVGLAQRINETTGRLHRLANSYNSILRRLEL